MIRLVEHHSIDKRKYDLCVSLDKTGLAYAYSWYLDTLTHNWEALVLNDYDAVWPLPFRRKFGLKYYYRPYAVQQLGVFSKTDLTDEVYIAFIEKMKTSCHYADVYLNEGQAIGLEIGKVKFSENSNYTLDLKRSYQEIYKLYKSNTKRNIKKTRDAKFSLFEQDGPEVLIDLFRNSKGANLGLSEEFYRNLQAAMYGGMHNGFVSIWTLYDPRNIVLAGACFVKTDKRVTLLFTGQSPEGRELNSMFYLLNEYIIMASERDLLFDFEGSNSESLARFYAGFGAQLNEYYRLEYNGLPWPLSLLKR